jgi:hypothetical protein
MGRSQDRQGNAHLSRVGTSNSQETRSPLKERGTMDSVQTNEFAPKLVFVALTGEAS